MTSWALAVAARRNRGQACPDRVLSVQDQQRGRALHLGGPAGAGLCPALRDAGPAGRWPSGAALGPGPPISRLQIDRGNLSMRHKQPHGFRWPE